MRIGKKRAACRYTKTSGFLHARSLVSRFPLTDDTVVRFYLKQREINMKTLHWKPILVAAIALLAIGGQAKAQSTDRDGCSN